MIQIEPVNREEEHGTTLYLQQQYIKYNIQQHSKTFYLQFHLLLQWKMSAKEQKSVKS